MITNHDISGRKPVIRKRNFSILQDGLAGRGLTGASWWGGEEAGGIIWHPGGE